MNSLTSPISKKRHEIVVYVAGPYTAPTFNELHNNIQAARQVAVELWKLGFTVFCPHMNSFMMDGIIPHADWYERDLVILERCDVIVLIEGWQNSKGAVGERNFAAKEDKLIIEWSECVSRTNFLRRFER